MIFPCVSLGFRCFQQRPPTTVFVFTQAIGVLIGFAWERCFDVAVDETAEREASEGILPPSLVKVVLALMLATLVVPAWRWYILPVVRELGGFEEGEEEDEETGAGAKEGYMPPILPEDLYLFNREQRPQAPRANEDFYLQHLSVPSTVMNAALLCRGTFIDEVSTCVARYHSCPVDGEMWNLEERRESIYVSRLPARAEMLQLDMTPTTASESGTEFSTDSPVTFTPLVLSYGSYGHPELCHRPCVHLAKGQCAAGADCGYCHCQHNRPVHPDKKQRVFFNSLSYPQLLATVIPYIRHRLQTLLPPTGSFRLMQLLEREVLLRPAEACGIRDRQLTQLLSRMSLAGLVGLLSVRSPAPVLALLRNYMEDLRLNLKDAEGPTGSPTRSSRGT
eukprot:s14_g56.t1